MPANQTFSFTGGTNVVQTGTFLVQGTLNVQNSATLEVEGGLTINGSGSLSTSSNSTLDVSGNLLGNITSAADFNPLGTVMLNSAAGTGNPPQLLEAMSQDLGNVAAGYSNNFAYGTLELTANTYVELVDNAANSPGNAPEAIYVNTLIVPAGATLNLDGLHVYAHTEQINGTIVNGGAVVSGEVYDDANDNGSLDTGDTGLCGLDGRSDEYVDQLDLHDDHRLERTVLLDRHHRRNLHALGGRPVRVRPKLPPHLRARTPSPSRRARRSTIRISGTKRRRRSAAPCSTT